MSNTTTRTKPASPGRSTIAIRHTANIGTTSHISATDRRVAQNSGGEECPGAVGRIMPPRARAGSAPVPDWGAGSGEFDAPGATWQGRLARSAAAPTNFLPGVRALTPSGQKLPRPHGFPASSPSGCHATPNASPAPCQHPTIGHRSTQ